MKAVYVVLVILGMYGGVHATVQSFRHVFILFIEPRGSVLTEFEDVERRIAQAKSLDELVALYDEAKKRTAAEKRNADREQFHRPLQEAETNEYTLKSAIEGWEQRRTDMRSLHFFWWCGVVAAGCGLWAFHLFNRWLGVTWLLTGFGLMVYWTSPPVEILGGHDEFNSLVIAKLTYSIVALALLIAVWWHLKLPPHESSVNLTSSR